MPARFPTVFCSEPRKGMSHADNDCVGVIPIRMKRQSQFPKSYFYLILRSTGLDPEHAIKVGHYALGVTFSRCIIALGCYK